MLRSVVEEAVARLDVIIEALGEIAPADEIAQAMRQAMDDMVEGAQAIEATITEDLDRKSKGLT